MGPAHDGRPVIYASPMAQSVRDIMSTDVMTLRPEDNLLAIREAMEALHIRHVPVVDDDKLVGLITHRDILRLTIADADPSRLSGTRLEEAQANTFVQEVMTTKIVTIPPETTVAKAAEMLVKHHFGCLPVVDASGKLVGIVTEHDLLKFLARDLFED